MPTLESKLIIGATDQTGGAFSAIQKHIAALDEGRETTIDFEALVQHRRENISRTESAPSSAPSSIPILKGRANEAALNIRAQRQIRELDIAERIGALTPTREVRAAAAEAMSALRNAFALSLNDSAAALAHAFNTARRRRCWWFCPPAVRLRNLIASSCRR